MCGDGEREEVVELLPVVQSLNIVYGQVLLQFWTDTGEGKTERVQRCGGREGGGGRGERQRGRGRGRGERQRGRGRGRRQSKKGDEEVSSPTHMAAQPQATGCTMKVDDTAENV